MTDVKHIHWLHNHLHFHLLLSSREAFWDSLQAVWPQRWRWSVIWWVLSGEKTKRIYRRIYIANFAIFKIATFWSYHLHLREKSWSFSFTKLRDFLVGSVHVRSQATVHACSMHEGRRYRYTFQRARVASSPEVPQGHVMKFRDISRLPFTLANFAWNFATFQKNRTPAWYFSGDVSRVFMRSC